MDVVTLLLARGSDIEHVTTVSVWTILCSPSLPLSLPHLTSSYLLPYLILLTLRCLSFSSLLYHSISFHSIPFFSAFSSSFSLSHYSCLYFNLSFYPYYCSYSCSYFYSHSYSHSCSYSSLTTQQGETALTEAARRGHSKLLELLLDHGADIEHASSVSTHSYVLLLILIRPATATLSLCLLLVLSPSLYFSLLRLHIKSNRVIPYLTLGPVHGINVRHRGRLSGVGRNPAQARCQHRSLP